MRKNNVVDLVSVILGTFIGAGFVGGREVAQYFSKYGFFAVFMFFVIFVLFYIFIKTTLLIGNKYRYNDKKHYSIYKKYSSFVNVLIFVSVIINVGSMIAGAYSIGMMFNMDLLRFIVPSVVVVGCFFVVKNRYNAMKNVNVVAVPLIIFAILIITVVTISTASNITIPIQNIFSTIFGGITSSVLYVLFNMFLLGVLLIQIGYKYSYKDINRASWVSSIIISLLVLIVSLSITLSDESVYNSDIPLLQECININYYLAYIFALCQLLGVFTTIISSCYISANMLSVKIKSYDLAIVLSLLMGCVISLIGFSNIVNYLYTLVGIMSLVYFAILLFCINPKEIDFTKKSVFRNKI